MKIRRIVPAASLDVVSQVLPRQCISKVLRRATFEHGLQSGRLVRYTYGPGEMILPRRNTEEWVRWTSPTEMLMIELPDDALQAAAHETGTDRIEIEGIAHFEDGRVAALIEAVECEQATGFLSGRLYLDGIGHALAAAVTQARGVLRRPLRSRMSGLGPAQLRRVTEYIHEQLDREMTVAQLAETAGMSPAHFSQMFRRSTGYAPHQFVLRARIDRAKLLLRIPEKRIIDVALACGFETPQHFARVFQRFCRITPTRYRRHSQSATI